MRSFNFIFLVILFSVKLEAQDSVAYSRDYEFREGLFLTIDQFKHNDPVLKSAIVSGYPKTQVDFMKEIMDNKFVTYKDKEGKEQKIGTLDIWGYSQNRTIYVNFNKDFNRVNVIGTLCHFTATVIVQSGYQDPMNNYGINTQNELRQFVLNTRTNKILEFNVTNMENILMDDPALYSEFMKLKKRKKADAIFIYLRMYNEKHPLYLPK